MWTRYGKWDEDGLRVRNQHGQVIYERTDALELSPYRRQRPEREAESNQIDVWASRNIKSG